MSQIQRTAALIISTYNWPEALAVVLNSAADQSVPPVQLVITDDGSRKETAEQVEKVLRPTKLEWCHVHQNDDGFRQARARNLGVRYSSASQLVFIDHDTLLHPDFVFDHLRCSQRGIFLQGKRAFLPYAFTQRVLASSDDPLELPPPWLAGLGNRKNAFRSPWLGQLLMRPRRFQVALRGSNLSVCREDFMRVDGFDEAFDGAWGREDSDFCYRLFHNGVRCRNLWFTALQYHLHHATESKRRERDHLDEELDRVRMNRKLQAQQGYSKMSGEGEVVAASEGYCFP